MILTEYNEELHDRTMKDEGRISAIVDSIRNLMNSTKWSRDEAMNALQISQDERKAIAALI